MIIRTICGAVLVSALVSCSSTDLLPGPKPATGPPIKVWFTQGGDLHLAYENGVSSGDALLDRAREALVVLLEGPSTTTAAEGVTTQIPQGTRLEAIRLAQEGASSVVVVELSPEFASAQDRPLAIGQVIFTASQFMGEHQIRIEVEGDRIARGTKAGWVGRLEPIVLHEPIFVDEPAEVIGGSVVIRGNAVATGRSLVMSVSTDDGTPSISRELQLSCKGGPQCRDRFVATLTVPGCATEGLLRTELLRKGETEAVKEVALSFQRPPSCEN